MDKNLYLEIAKQIGEPIDPARLEVRPDATLCLSWQQEVERLAKRSAARLRNF